MSEQSVDEKQQAGEAVRWGLPVWLEAALVALILALAGYLRLAFIQDAPGWYSDEGTLVDIAHHLAQGRIQYMALQESTLLAARPPLFVLLLSGLFRLFGADIVVLRAFTGSLGVLSVGLLYGFTRRAVYPRQVALPLLAALMLAIFPDAILYSRLGFSYNLLAALALAGAWALWIYLDGGRAAWACLAALLFGLGTVSDLMMISMTPVLAGALLLNRRAGWGWALLCLGLPFAAYCALMLAIAGQAFTFDFAFTFARLGNISFLFQAPYLWMNMGALLFYNVWWALGVLGLFLLQPLRLRWLALAMLFIPLAALGRTAWLTGLLYYYLIPLLPWLMLGLAGLLMRAGPHLAAVLHEGLSTALERLGWQVQVGVGAWLKNQTIFLGARAGLFLILVGPFLLSAVYSCTQMDHADGKLVETVLVNPQDGRQAADYLNQAAGPQELVIASPAMAWALHARTADFQQTLAANHLPSEHFPIDVDPRRFAYQLSVERASFVVVDPVWVNWAAPSMTGVADMLAVVEQWPLAFQAGDVRVYHNPQAANLTE